MTWKPHRQTRWDCDIVTGRDNRITIHLGRKCLAYQTSNGGGGSTLRCKPQKQMSLDSFAERFCNSRGNFFHNWFFIPTTKEKKHWLVTDPLEVLPPPSFEISFSLSWHNKDVIVEVSGAPVHCNLKLSLSRNSPQRHKVVKVSESPFPWKRNCFHCQFWNVIEKQDRQGGS